MKEIVGKEVQVFPTTLKPEMVERALTINKAHHQHINRYIFSIGQESQYWLVSRWAVGGNLEDFWQRTPQPPCQAGLVRNMIEQFRGLADALYYLHTKDVAHGGIKPTNILRTEDSTTLGHLVLSDAGIAGIRGPFVPPESPRYEPPETLRGLDHNIAPKSQYLDIWSVGCIIFETLIWFLYGTRELHRFHTDLGQQSCFFETRLDDHNELIAVVHSAVEAWMNHMMKDPECAHDTAIRDLLELVSKRLLVFNTQSQYLMYVALDEMAEDEDKIHRATARELRDSLDYILSKEAKMGDSYLITSSVRAHLQGPTARD